MCLEVHGGGRWIRRPRCNGRRGMRGIQNPGSGAPERPAKASAGSSRISWKELLIEFLEGALEAMGA
eukprot:2074904-Pyramimonas_sp.AAC.1